MMRALGVVLALAMAVLEAHLPMAPARGPAPDLSAYAMPDGTLPSLCLTMDDPDGDGSATGDHCPECVIAKVLAVLAPSVPHVSGATPLAVARLSAETLVIAERPRAPPARGPPAPLSL